MKNRKYLIAIIIGILFTPSAVSYAVEQRQYFAIGSEWLLIPLFLLVSLTLDSMKELYREFIRSTEYDK